MDSLVETAISKNLTQDEVSELTLHKCRVCTYAELKDCTSLQEAAGEFGAVICLIETKDNYGHWVAWFQVDDETWEWFDSYAVCPDGELNFVPVDYLEESKQEPLISRLIRNAKETTKLIYNQVQLQKLAKGVDTCGRWAGVRIRKRHVPLAEFQRLFVQQSKSPDWLITNMTMLNTVKH